MFKSLKRKEARAQEALNTLYLATVAHCREPKFYSQYGITDNLPGRFSVIVLHLFLLMNRMGMAEKQSQTLFDTFFYDMDRSMRESGVGDLAVPKRIKKMMKVFYEDAELYTTHFKTEKKLEKALSHTLYQGKKVPKGMVKYCLKQKTILDDCPIEALTSDFNFKF